ncbi:Anti-sigma F factor antagonist [Actinoplanes sp. SE50]|nr:Anti-sigma F factor antagonist [Actinoplanes sp. SE50/110]ATO82738.1 Anti-sigma F factor antagonist [Actinoplanes sp. SE50]SLM00145.1 hypothetical protein ACSP50_3377 [Actinoplanes sp. SE50/110]
MPPRHPVTITMGGIDDGTVHLTVAGEIDLATADVVYDAIAAAADTPAAQHVEINLRHVEFCDSTGIGALMRARHFALEHAVTLHVVEPSGFVRRVLELAGVLEILTEPK